MLTIKPSQEPSSKDKHLAQKLQNKIQIRFGHRFQHLGEDQTQRGLFLLIRAIWQRIVTFFFDWRDQIGRSENFPVLFSVEHLGQGKLSGISHSLALQSTLQLLEKESFPHIKSLINSLQYSYQLLQQRESLFSSTCKKQIPIIKQKISSLKVGEAISLPCDTTDHSMMLEVIRCSDKEGSSSFKVRLHNTGDGIEWYHYRKIERGVLKYQTAFDIDNVSLSSLCAPHSDFFNRIFSNSLTVKSLYTEILPSLEGVVAPPHTDRRLWSHGQFGGSCSASSVKALIRSHLKAKEYKEFSIIARTELALSSYQKIIHGCGNNTTQKIVTLEMIHRLNQSLHKQGITLPKPLKKIRNHLVQLIHKIPVKNKKWIKQPPIGPSRVASLKAQKKLVHLNRLPITCFLTDDKTLASETIIDNVNMAFACIKEKASTEELLLQADEYIQTALKKMEKKKLLSIKEQGNLISFGVQLANFTQEKPLTERQLYSITALCSLLYEALLAQQIAIPKGRLEQISLLCYTMFDRFQALRLFEKSKQRGYGRDSFDLSLHRLESSFVQHVTGFSPPLSQYSSDAVFTPRELNKIIVRNREK